jgi:2-(1,2-epoxy-1,2-dihydrophenyl)acetyl-CoA isomerase
MAFKALRLAVDDGIGRLTFTDPARGNPVDGVMCRELRQVADMIAGRADVRALLVTAEGPAFSYGGDIAAFVRNLDDLPALIGDWVADLNAAIVRLQALDAPIIAAVQGVCAGGMAGFAAGADIVVASREVQFVAAYAGIGFCCDAGASITLARRIGPARATRYFLLNETIRGDEAMALGLVDELVDQAALAERGEQIARRIARGPTRAFGEIRRLLRSAATEPLETQLALEARALVRCAGSAEAREGITAFAARRKPDFTAPA